MASITRTATKILIVCLAIAHTSFFKGYVDENPLLLGLKRSLFVSKGSMEKLTLFVKEKMNKNMASVMPNV